MSTSPDHDPIGAIIDQLPPLMRRAQIAELLGITERTVDRMLRRGELTGYRVARTVQIPRAELERLLRRAAEAA